MIEPRCLTELEPIAGLFQAVFSAAGKWLRRPGRPFRVSWSDETSSRDRERQGPCPSRGSDRGFVSGEPVFDSRTNRVDGTPPPPKLLRFGIAEISPASRCRVEKSPRNNPARTADNPLPPGLYRSRRFQPPRRRPWRASRRAAPPGAKPSMLICARSHYSRHRLRTASRRGRQLSRWRPRDVTPYSCRAS
jgi:hypothetical protein